MKSQPNQVRSQYPMELPNMFQSQFAMVESAIEQLRTIVGETLTPAGRHCPPMTTSARVHQIIKARRARDDFFRDVSFADPAWDILLEAFAAQLQDRRLSVSGLCHCAAVPATTALRWIGKLEEGGWLVRLGDPLDGRRFWVELSSNACVLIERYFQTVATELPPI